MLAVVVFMHCEPAEHEFREQPVTALLQVAAIRHLRHQVGRAQQLADDAMLGIVELDVAGGLLVTAVVHDLRRGRGGATETDADQISFEETRAPRDVSRRVLGAVLDVVVLVQDVAGVVEQRDDQPDLGAVRADPLARRRAALVAGDQPAHRQVMSSVCWMS